MRPLWRGWISFGLMSIPVTVHSAISEKNISFRQLRKSDLSPIGYKKVAKVDKDHEEDVEPDEIVKGYEYDKEEFVVVSDDDLKSIEVKSTKVANITEFVDMREVNSMFFDSPYYLSPEKGGEKPYVLLQKVLQKSGKVGIAKLAIRKREFLACIKPEADKLVLELMRFADEIVPPDSFKVPSPEVSAGELRMGEQLVKEMSVAWQPEKYHDEYREAVWRLIESKRKDPGKPAAHKKHGPRPKTSKLIDMMDVLKLSVEQASKQPKNKPARRRRQDSGYEEAA